MAGNVYVRRVLSTLLVTLVFFLVANVFLAQTIQSTLLTAADGESALTSIVFLGFIMAWLIAMGVNYLINDGIPQLQIFYASIYATLYTLLFWVLIAFWGVLSAYPEIIPAPAAETLFEEVVARGVGYFVSIPRMMAYYALYIVSDYTVAGVALERITVFWILVAFSYTPIFTWLLYDLGKGRRKDR